MSLSRLIEPLTTDFNPALHNDELVNTIAETISKIADFEKEYKLLKEFMIQGSAGPAMCITTKMNKKKETFLIQCQHILSGRFAMDSMESLLSQHKAVFEELSASIKAILVVVDGDYDKYKKSIPWARDVDPQLVLESVKNYKNPSTRLSPKSPRSLAKVLSQGLKKMVFHTKDD